MSCRTMSASLRPACGWAKVVLSNFTTSTGFPAPPARPENGEASAAMPVSADALADGDDVVLLGFVEALVPQAVVHDAAPVRLAHVLEDGHVLGSLRLLLIAGAGDELQGIKRGIMESVDIIAFTKAEGTAREKALAAKFTPATPTRCAP